MEISVKGLSKKYKGNKLGLNKLDLELKNGILGLIAYSGNDLPAF
jgi:ABC-type multidrug transport system ATPase subunit